MGLYFPDIAEILMLEVKLSMISKCLQILSLVSDVDLYLEFFIGLGWTDVLTLKIKAWGVDDDILNSDGDGVLCIPLFDSKLISES